MSSKFQKVLGLLLLNVVLLSPVKVVEASQKKTCPNPVTVLALLGALGLGSHMVYTVANPHARSERAVLGALNATHGRYHPNGSEGPFVDVDDLFDLSTEENRQTETFLKFLSEEANVRKLREIPGIQNINVVRDRRDERVKRVSSDYIRIYISSQGTRSDWRSSLDRLSKEASEKSN